MQFFSISFKHSNRSNIAYNDTDLKLIPSFIAITQKNTTFKYIYLKLIPLHNGVYLRELWHYIC